MHRTNLRHLAAAAAMTLGVGALCAPVAWLQLGTAGLKLVGYCGVAVFLVAVLSDLLTWLLRGVASPAVSMVSGAACRMLFVIAMMVFALKASPADWTGVEAKYLAVYLIPFYFGLLVVEVFAAKTILSGSLPAAADRADDLAPQATA